MNTQLAEQTLNDLCNLIKTRAFNNLKRQIIREGNNIKLTFRKGEITWNQTRQQLQELKKHYHQKKRELERRFQ